MRARQLLEGGARADLVEQALRFLRGGQQDLLGVHFFLHVQLRAVLLEPGAHLGGGRLFAAGLLGHPLLREQAFAHVLRELLGGLTVLREPLGERLAGRAGGLGQPVHRGLHLGVGGHHPGCLRALNQERAVDQRIEQRTSLTRQFLRVELRGSGETVHHLRAGPPARSIQLAL